MTGQLSLEIKSFKYKLSLLLPSSNPHQIIFDLFLKSKKKNDAGQLISNMAIIALGDSLAIVEFNLAEN